MAAPFQAAWGQLLADWGPPHPAAGAQLPHPAILRGAKDLTSVLAGAGGSALSEEDESCLVPVRILIEGRGTLGDNTMICLPLQTDLQALAGTVMDKAFLLPEE